MKKKFRMLGLRRSGNHAIINWIRKQLPDNCVFINYTRTLENPYRDVYRNQIMLRNNPGFGGGRCEDIEWWKEESRGNLPPKKSLIYSYEDQEIDGVVHPSFEKKHDFYLGKSRARYDVLIIRDPFNLFASRIMSNKPKGLARPSDFMKVYSHRLTLPELWISYAQECLRETNKLPNKKLSLSIMNGFLTIAIEN